MTRHLTEKTNKIMALVLLLTLPFFTISCDNDDDETSMPEPTMNIVEIAASTPELSTLTAAIVEAGLVDALSGDTPKWTLGFNIGRYYQLPAYTVMGYRDNEGSLVNKENNITYINSDHIVTGIEFKPTNYSKISLEGFYKKYKNYPFLMNYPEAEPSRYQNNFSCS